jgi:hypothetical protein
MAKQTEEQLYELNSTKAVKASEIEDSVVAEIRKLVANGKQPALELSGGDFTNEREVAAPVTKESLAGYINDMRTSMENTPFPWTLKLVHPSGLSQHLESEKTGKMVIGIHSVSTLAQFTK